MLLTPTSDYHARQWTGHVFTGAELVSAIGTQSKTPHPLDMSICGGIRRLARTGLASLWSAGGSKLYLGDSHSASDRKTYSH